MEVEVEERIEREFESNPESESESRDLEMNNKLFLGDQIKINARLAKK